MRWLLFLSRLAFISGIFFLIALSIRVYNWTHDETISSTIIILGYAIGLIVVPLVNLSYLAVLIVKRKLTIYVPAWLITANIFFLLILIIYIIYINDPVYH